MPGFDEVAGDDAELIARARAGETGAFARLYERHRAAALRFAAHWTREPLSEVDDLVAEAFTQVFVQLRRGAGPTQSFAAYVKASIRHLHACRCGRTGRTTPTDDEQVLDLPVDFEDVVVRPSSGRRPRAHSGPCRCGGNRSCGASTSSVATRPSWLPGSACRRMLCPHWALVPGRDCGRPTSANTSTAR